MALRLLTKQDKSVIFPALCYLSKINELIFFDFFKTYRVYRQTYSVCQQSECQMNGTSVNGGCMINWFFYKTGA